MLITFTAPVYADEAQINKIAEALTADNSSEKNEQVNKVAAGNNDISLSNEDAKKVYDEFYNDVKYTENNEEWDNAVFIQYKLFESDYIEWFEKYVKGGTKEIFHPMSLFDKFIWSESYLRFAWAVNVGKFDTYYGNEKNFAEEKLAEVNGKSSSYTAILSNMGQTITVTNPKKITPPTGLHRELAPYLMSIFGFAAMAGLYFGINEKRRREI